MNNIKGDYKTTGLDLYYDYQGNLCLREIPVSQTRSRNLMNIGASLLVPLLPDISFLADGYYCSTKEQGDSNDYFYGNNIDYTGLNLRLGLKIYLGSKK